MTIKLTPPIYAEFSQDQDITIHSLIMYDHTNLTSIQTRWTLENSSNQTVTDVVNTHQLSLPGGRLTIGEYRVSLSVHLLRNENRLTSSSASTTIRIVSSTIRVHLSPTSASSISHGYRQELLLSPGHFSFDPNRTPFPAQVNSLEWRKLVALLLCRCVRSGTTAISIDWTE